MPALPVLAAVAVLAGLSVLVGAAASVAPAPDDGARRSSPSWPPTAVASAVPPPGAGTAPTVASGARAAPLSGAAQSRVALPGAGQPRVALPGAAPRAARSAYRWPLAPPPAVLRRFVVGPERWSPGHRGVDLAAAAGDQVLAAGPGVVTFAGMVAGRGVVAVLHSDGIRTTYEPVTASVSAGDVVAGGAPLGPLTSGQHCTGSCLHWGALRGDTYLDPLSLLAPPEPPVLLPLGTAGPATTR